MNTQELTTLYDRLMTDLEAGGIDGNIYYYTKEVCRAIDILIGMQQVVENEELSNTRFFCIESLEELQELRKKLKATFGTWSDKLTNIRGARIDRMIASYEGLHEIHIEMSFDGNNPPEGLIPPTCRIEEETVSTTEHSYYTLRCNGEK